MPPKAKITKEMVLEAAFRVARQNGADCINARTGSKAIGCSTQPVMYYFSSIDELKGAVYAKADDYHTNYLLNISTSQEDVLLEIGLNYIRFAVHEPNLFKFLFQSGYAKENSLLEMIDSEEIKPLIAAMQEAMNIDLESTKEIFITLAMFVHGYASIIANNSLECDEQLISKHLERVYRGALSALKEDIK